MPRQLIAVQRIKNDLEDILGCEGISAEVINGDFLDLKGHITGPAQTPYEGGHFVVEIKLPRDYPFKPPKVKFVTKIWHPNVSSATGAIGLDILSSEWITSQKLRTILLSIQALLSDANPDIPQDAVVAEQYKEDYEMFCQTAKHWTLVYATPLDRSHIPLSFDEKIQTLVQMGKNEDEARVALSSCFWDLEKAAELLFT